MKVLLSVKPEFAEKIFQGSKQYEYRRTIFRRAGITTVVVYVSTPVKKVVGEFEIDEIIHEEPHSLWERTGQQSGISEEGFLRYFRDKAIGHAIRVRNPRKYDNPFIVGDLHVPAPQSFTYL